MDTAANPVKVYLVDDSSIVRERLIEMIDELPGFAVVGEAESAGTAINGILLTQPDCVVLDLQLANSMGLTVLRVVHRQAPDIAIVVLTNHATTQYSSLCRDAGARYFFDKSTEMNCVCDSLNSIAMLSSNKKINH